MTIDDFVLLCLCYLHLLEHRPLPSCLFEPVTSLPSRIVRKEPFAIAWQTRGVTHRVVVDDLLRRCEERCDAGAGARLAMLPLCRCLVSYEIFNDRLESARALCDDWLRQKRHLAVVVEVAAKVYELDRIFEVMLEATSSCDALEIVTCLEAARVLRELKHSDEALRILEQAVTRFFVVGNQRKIRPNHLFR